MAIAHLHMKIVSRAEGHNAVAAAAYRSGQKLNETKEEADIQGDDRSAVAKAAYQAGQVLAGEVGEFDFSHKRGVVLAEIIAPPGAPSWVYDRERLWQTVEAAEKHPRAQLARDCVIALPHELSDQERYDLVRKFVVEQFVSRGMIADLAIHRPSHDDRNHHAHVMLTMRRIDENGFAKTKARDWNPEFKRGRAKNGKLLDGFVADTNSIEYLRDQWGKHANAALKAAGYDAQIDMRTLEAQREDALGRGDHDAAAKLDRIPTRKIGKALYSKGERLRQHAEIVAENKRLVDLDERIAVLSAENVALGLSTQKGDSTMSYMDGAARLESGASPSTQPMGEERRARRGMTIDGMSGVDWLNQRMPEQNEAAMHMVKKKDRPRGGRDR